MNQFKLKLDEIIDFDMKDSKKTWENEKIIELEKKYNLYLNDDYFFYLKEYGNDYIDPKYKCIPQEAIPGCEEVKFEIDSIYGLDIDENNIFEKIDSYKDILPENLVPIADLPGGDLICMEKEKGWIYFWFHDWEDENLFKVFNTFKEFILSFTVVKDVTITPGEVKMDLGSQLDAFLKNASKKQ
ncbi:SMI1/KNR4 family protein [Bacillus sp. JRC01]|nr:SMI1/KNR4 family protein [Bacillus sp. JRC01]